MKNNGIQLILLSGLLVSLVGCSDKQDDIRQFITEVKNTSPTPPDPLPPIDIPVGKSYTGKVFSDPFAPPVQKSVLTETFNGKTVKCEFKPENRTPTPLETFDLESVQMKGVVERDNTTWGLVFTPNSQLHRIKVGDYLGLNHGQVIDVKQDKIMLQEWVSDRDGCLQSKVTELLIATESEQS